MSDEHAEMASAAICDAVAVTFQCARTGPDPEALDAAISRVEATNLIVPGTNFLMHLALLRACGVMIRVAIRPDADPAQPFEDGFVGAVPLSGGPPTGPDFDMLQAAIAAANGDDIMPWFSGTATEAYVEEAQDAIAELFINLARACPVDLTDRFRAGYGE